jgi:15-cis-phytoene synthase
MADVMADAFTYCTDLVRAADKDRFLASLFAPEQHRGALMALYAFAIEVARVRDAAREPLPGEIRLQWWREVLLGERGGEASANPVASALMTTIGRYALPAGSLLDLVEAHRFDLYDEPMATMAELEAYAVATASNPMSLAMRILGGDEHNAESAKPGGIAFAITRLLLAFPQHAARRQLFVPTDLLRRHGATVEDVFAATKTPALQNAIGELRAAAMAYLVATGRLLPQLPDAVVPALLPLAPVRLELDRMGRNDYDPFAPPDVLQWRRQWAIWRAARNVRRIAG